MKRRLSEQQEFEIMKLVLDKFLWLGFGIMAYGLYQMYSSTIQIGLSWIIAGAVILLIFAWIIVKEYEIVRQVSWFFILIIFDILARLSQWQSAKPSTKICRRRIEFISLLQQMTQIFIQQIVICLLRTDKYCIIIFVREYSLF